MIRTNIIKLSYRDIFKNNILSCFKKEDLTEKLEELTLKENAKFSFKFNRVNDESPDDDLDALVSEKNKENFG